MVSRSLTTQCYRQSLHVLPDSTLSKFRHGQSRSDQNIGAVESSLLHSLPDSAPILPDSRNHTYLGTAARKVQQANRTLSSRNAFYKAGVEAKSHATCHNKVVDGFRTQFTSSCGTVLDFWSNGHRRGRHILRQARMK
jgi:hypothetical protein